jgi:hypothetical protein
VWSFTEAPLPIAVRNRRQSILRKKRRFRDVYESVLEPRAKIVGFGTDFTLMLSLSIQTRRRSKGDDPLFCQEGTSPGVHPDDLMATLSAASKAANVTVCFSVAVQ